MMKPFQSCPSWLALLALVLLTAPALAQVPQDMTYPGRLVDDLGTLSLAMSEKMGYCGFQFFVCLGKLPNLDGKFPVIGAPADKEIEDKITSLGKSIAVDRDSDKPKSPILIKKIQIVTR